MHAVFALSYCPFVKMAHNAFWDAHRYFGVVVKVGRVVVSMVKSQQHGRYHVVVVSCKSYVVQ